MKTGLKPFRLPVFHWIGMAFLLTGLWARADGDIPGDPPCEEGKVTGDLRSQALSCEEVAKRLLDEKCQKLWSTVPLKSATAADLADSLDNYGDYLGDCTKSLDANGYIRLLRDTYDITYPHELKFVSKLFQKINREFPGADFSSYVQFMSLKLKDRGMNFFIDNEFSDLNKSKDNPIATTMSFDQWKKIAKEKIEKMPDGSKHVFLVHSPDKAKGLNHYTPVMVEKRKGACRIYITDSLGPKTLDEKTKISPIDKYHSEIETMELTGCNTYTYSHEGATWRQADDYTCPVFSLYDGVKFAKHDGLFNYVEKPGMSAPIPGKSNIHLLNQLPPELVVPTQSYGTIEKYQKSIGDVFPKERISQAVAQAEKNRKSGKNSTTSAIYIRNMELLLRHILPVGESSGKSPT